MPFTCSICEEASTQICARCTKDTCGNHLCEKCLRCSDCCECEVTLEEKSHAPMVRSMTPVPEEPELAVPEAAAPEVAAPDAAAQEAATPESGEPALPSEPDPGAILP